MSCTAGDTTDTSSGPPIVRVGVLPDQDSVALKARYEPLLRHLDQAANVRTELFIATGYNELVDTFRADELDLAWFGGLTYLQADADGTARPLVMRDVDLGFTTDLLVSADAKGRNAGDFSGADFAFGPELSTSGHLMPRFFLEQQGVIPEEHFGSVAYSVGHDETAAWVRDGVVDIGAVNSVVAESLFRSGELSPDQVRVLTRTDPYRNYTWVTPTDLDDGLRTSLLDAFLGLDPRDPADQAVLSGVGAGSFVPSTSSDFEELRAAAVSLGLLDPEDS